MNSADEAYARGDLATASGLYERVLNTPPASENATATSAIDQFAHFRYMVTLLAQGNENEAKAQLTALQQADANAPFTRLAAQLWDQYGMVGSLRGACAQVQPQIGSQASETLDALHALGITADAQTLCSLPAS